MNSDAVVRTTHYKYLHPKEVGEHMMPAGAVQRMGSSVRARLSKPRHSFMKHSAVSSIVLW